MRMKRVVVFLPMAAAVQACDDLAARYGSNRSEVFRLAIVEGMPGAVEALEKLREIRMVEALGAGASRSWRIRGMRRSVLGRAVHAASSIRIVPLLFLWTTAVPSVRLIAELTEEDIGAHPAESTRR